LTFKIAHISDLHWESRDQSVVVQLKNAMQREQPNLVVFTGDLVDNPNPYRVRDAKAWLFELCAELQIDHKAFLLVVPGNHDYRLLGNFGFRPLTAIPFRWHFRELGRKRVVFVERGDGQTIAFLRIDSNPVIRGLARGNVGWWELRRLKREIQKLPDDQHERLRRAMKVALLHHHPLPIPYGGTDRFLFLKDAQRLLQFLAEQRVDMVLHGHKHRAPYSLLSFGSIGTDDRIIEVLGAGAAFKQKDFDPRGHNFNLICIEPDGLRYVRQFFCPPQGRFEEWYGSGYPAQSFVSAYRRAWNARGFRLRSLRWDMLIDSEGDRMNELAYRGLAVLEDAEFTTLKPPPYELESGHLSGISLVPERTDAGIYLTNVQHRSRKLTFEVGFGSRPTEQKPATFSIVSWDLNACALSLSEFDKKFPGRQPKREWEEKRIRTAVDDFYWTIRFPEVLRFGKPPEFEVIDPASDRRHDWLTQTLQPNFSYSQALHTATLSVHRPPGDFLYRIYWYVDDKNGPLPARPFQPVIDKFVRGCLTLAEERRQARPSTRFDEMNQVMNVSAHSVADEIDRRFGRKGLIDLAALDVSFMVNDGELPPDQPKLRMVASAGQPDENFWDFVLEEGDGNAGRAYKRNILRCFDQNIPDLKSQAYVTIPGLQPHQVLYSVPLRAPEDEHLIYGILNIGTFDKKQAGLLRRLNDEEGHHWLIAHGQKYVLQRLLAIV
jgi:predicted phosphodiesterase